VENVDTDSDSEREALATDNIVKKSNEVSDATTVLMEQKVHTPAPTVPVSLTEHVIPPVSHIARNSDTECDKGLLRSQMM